MRPGAASGRWWALLLFAAVLAGGPLPSYPVPDNPPPGYAWTDCRACHARMLQPADWLAKEDAVGCHFSPEAFPAAGWMEKGVIFYALKASQREGGKTADEIAVARIGETVAKRRVLRGSTRNGQPSGPYATYSLSYELSRDPDGKRFMFTAVYIANRKTGTLYVWVLKSPRAEWREVEGFEDTMLKSLQLDPEF